MKVQIRTKGFLLILGFLAMLLPGCEDDNGVSQVVLPDNLTITLTQSGDSGETINVIATADNTNFYRFDFGDGSSVEENTSGIISHTYSASGEYSLKVQAHATAVDFISETQSIDVSLPDPRELGYISPENYEGYNLVWQDDFNGTTLSDNWTYEIGGGGWGNNELQYYRQENTTVEDGLLYITAKSENFGGRNYTSSRIVTEGKQEFQYGRIDIRAILPKGQGIWPALWMLGSNFDDVGWPFCGEIDIMEMIGGNGRENTVHGTIHWDNNGQYANFGGSTSINNGIFADKFHVFSIIWDSEKIVWLLDNVAFHEVDITPQSLSEFRASYFFIFNVAVGGNWPGSPNSATQFPQQMIVDYIRVFQKP
jgi:beta-glucanase (GH16 family)